MYRIVPELASFLAPYLNGEVPLQEMRDGLYLHFQAFLGKATEDDKEMLSELLACIYEVEDGVMAEETFRKAITQFIERHSLSTHGPLAYRKRVYRISAKAPHRSSIKKLYRISVKRPYSVQIRQHSCSPRTTYRRTSSLDYFHPRFKRYLARKVRRDHRTIGQR